MNTEYECNESDDWNVSDEWNEIRWIIEKVRWILDELTENRW